MRRRGRREREGGGRSEKRDKKERGRGIRKRGREARRRERGGEGEARSGSRLVQRVVVERRRVLARTAHGCIVHFRIR